MSPFEPSCSYVERALRVFGVLAVFAVLLSACGGKEAPADLCLDVICSAGVCEPATGECVNPAQCDGRGDCLPGYSCVGGSCAPNEVCNVDDDCERGICRNGVCTNATSCSESDACVDGFYCSDDGRCEQDACEDVTCTSGQCNRITGECVNKAACTVETESLDCVDGFLCYDRVCVTPNTLCEALDCENKRGACNVEERTCDNAVNCAGNDMNCLAGFYCADDDTCRANLCDAATGTCDRGVCEPGTGECVNDDPCQGNDQCVDGHYCVGGTCESITAACEPCSGNQRCLHDEDSLSVSCEENPAGCHNAFDCLEDRVCRDRHCVEPPACEADAFEPNDGLEEATNLNEAHALGLIEANVCGGDVDHYGFNTQGLGLVRGTLLAEVRTRSQDLGHGHLRVSLLNEQGDVLEEEIADASGVVELQRQLSPAQLGQYYIRVEDSGDVGPAGVHYTVFADLVSNEVATACQKAELLEPGEVTSSTLQGNSYELSPSCGTSPNLAPEDIYYFELTQRSAVELVAIPAADVDVTLSVRQSCLSVYSEVACNDAGANGVRERVNLDLDPGMYFVIVKGPRSNTGGSYTLQMKSTPIICRSGDAYCDGTTRSQVCNAAGTAFESATCAQGCDADSGLCIRYPGDACYAAIDASGGYRGTIEWTALTNEYEGVPGCYDDGVLTNGPDAAFVADVPPGQVLHAELTASADYASMHLVSDCQDMADSCLEAAGEAVQQDFGGQLKTLVWENQTAQSQRVYLIADTDLASVAGPASIEISIGARICVPGSARCANDLVEVCNVSGTAYLASHACPFGCAAGGTSCIQPENDTCKGAVDIMAEGGSFSAGIQDYSRTYNPGGNSCIAPGQYLVEARGPDAAFFVDAREGEIITAHLRANFNARLYVVTDCNDVARSCEAGDRSGYKEISQVAFTAPRQGRYFVIVDSNDTNATGAFDLDVYLSSGACSAGLPACDAAGERLAYCTATGAEIAHRCASSCSVASCDAPNGDICHDAIPVQSGDVVSALFEGIDFQHIPGGEVGTCQFDADGLGGVDTYYAVDLRAGELLFVEATSNSSAGAFYITRDCSGGDACLSNTRTGTGTNTLSHQADQDETVYVVAQRRTKGWVVGQSYTLSFNVSVPECVPGETFCQDPQTLAYCTPAGTLEAMPCLTGGCTDGKCNNPGGQSCFDAIALEPFAEVSGTLDGIDSITMPRGNIGSCNFQYETSRNDDIYSIDALEGQILEVEFWTNSNFTSVYLLGDCQQPTSCIDATRRDSTTQEGRLEIEIPRDGTYYLVVDAELTGSPDYHLSIALLDPGDCSPGEVVCFDDGKTLGFCTDEARYDVYRCADGCNPDGTCVTPRGGICEDARHIERDEQVVSGDFTNESTITVDVEDAGSCEFAANQSFDGRDTIYTVDVEAGELLQLYLDSRLSDAFVYLLAECGDGATCMADSAPGLSGSLEYLASEDERLYVVVSRGNQLRSTSTFDLYLYRQTPGCMPGEQLCYEDGQTLGVCDDNGRLQPYPCQGTCTDRACDTPSGDFCADAIELQAGDVVQGSWDGFDYINPGSGAHGDCTFPNTPGREKIYAIHLAEGEVVSAYLNSPSLSGRIYFLEECGAADTCAAISSSGRSQRLHHAATQSGIVYIVVDNTSSNVADASDSFTLAVDVQTPGLCYFGASQCGSRAGTIEVCNELEVFEAYDCASGSCVNGSCQNPDGDTCREPIPLVDGDVVTGGWASSSGRTNFLNPRGDGSESSCTFSANTTGPETIYSVTLQAGEVLTANMTTRFSSASLYVMENCYDTNTCMTAQSGSSTQVRYLATETRTVFLVADYSGTSNEPYELSLRVGFPECVPAEMGCSDDGLNVTTCDEAGFWQTTQECRFEGCSNGACEAPQGDSCAEAYPLTSGVAVTGDFVGTNTLNPGTGTVGQCQISSSMTGRELFYSIEAEAGDFVRVQLDTDVTNAFVYVLSDCTQGSSCVSAAPRAGAMAFGFIAEETANYYVVVDRSATTTTGTYELTVEVSPVSECDPGDVRCDIATNTLDRCMEYLVYENIPTTSCTEARGDFCWDAILVTDGAVVTGDWTGTDTMNPGTSPIGGCDLSRSASGRETFYQVELSAGDVLLAELDTVSAAGGLIYIVADCNDAASCLASSPETAPTSVGYRALDDETVFIVVDRGFAAVYNTPYTLSVTIGSSGECEAGDVMCGDADTLLYCNPAYTIWERLDCVGGCFNSECGEPQGDTCFDAVELVLNQPLQATANHNDLSNFHNPGLESCIYGTAAYIGGDFVAYIDLEEGDLLDIEMVTTASNPPVGIYILDSCGIDDAQACVAGVPSGTEAMQFVAPRTQRYYVVADITSVSNSTRSTLIATVTPDWGVCQPGGATCDPISGLLEVCSDDGKEVVAYLQCAHGCDRDYCAGPATANNTCAAAMDIDGPLVMIDSYERFSNSYSPGSACVGQTTAGRDAVYRVELAADEVLRASVTAVDTTTTRAPALFLSTSCSDINGSCEAGTYDTPTAKLDYWSEEGGVYYLVVDSRSSLNVSPFILSVDIEERQCLPGESVCDGNNLRVCNAAGLFEDTSCPYGCVEGACAMPSNDTCQDGFEVFDGTVLTAELSTAYTNAHDSGDPACTGGRDATGRDAVFYVDLGKNDLFRARLETSRFDKVLWVTADCEATGQACLVGDFKWSYSGPAEVSYRAPEAGRYYIVVDSYTSSTTTLPTGMFTLSVEIEPAVCEAHTVTCLDDATLGYCLADESGWGTTTCAQGCFDGACGAPTGDICPDAIEVGSGTYLETFDGATNHSSLGYGSCTGYDAPGPERFYAVSLTAGQTLTVTMSNVSGATNDLSLYLVEDCLMSFQTCLAGSDTYGEVAESLSYVATENKTIFVVADAYNTNASGQFQLAVDIQ